MRFHFYCAVIAVALAAQASAVEFANDEEMDLYAQADALGKKKTKSLFVEEELVKLNKGGHGTQPPKASGNGNTNSPIVFKIEEPPMGHGGQPPRKENTNSRFVIEDPMKMKVQPTGGHGTLPPKASGNGNTNSPIVFKIEEPQMGHSGERTMEMLEE